VREVYRRAYGALQAECIQGPMERCIQGQGQADGEGEGEGHGLADGEGKRARAKGRVDHPAGPPARLGVPRGGPPAPHAAGRAGGAGRQGLDLVRHENPNDSDEVRADAALAAALDLLRAALRANGAACLLDLGRPADAVEDCDAALAARPGYGAALYRRGVGRRALGELEGAEADLAEAAVRDPALAPRARRELDAVRRLRAAADAACRPVFKRMFPAAARPPQASPPPPAQGYQVTKLEKGFRR
jgi:tetratricopeptide (TPR) repeat protein